MKIFFFLMALSLAATAATERTIKVQGSCEIQVIPDRARISFTSEHQSKDPKDAAAKTTEQMNRLKASIKKLSLKDQALKNTSYAVYPVREWENNRMVDKGHRASLTLEVITSEIEKIGEAMELASKAGITQAGQLEMFLSPEKNREEYARCLEIAADNAKSKARALSKKLDFTVGEVLEVQEGTLVQVPVPHPPMPMMRGAMEAKAQTTQIEAGKQNYTTQINVSFRIK